MAVTAMRGGACHIGLVSQTRRKALSKHSATSKQVGESTDRELTENELEHVSGGKPGAAPKDPPVRESISLPYSSIAWAYGN